MKGHIQDYFHERAIELLKEAVEIVSTNDRPLDANTFAERTENLIAYSRCHADASTKELI